MRQEIDSGEWNRYLSVCGCNVRFAKFLRRAGGGRTRQYARPYRRNLSEGALTLAACRNAVHSMKAGAVKGFAFTTLWRWSASRRRNKEMDGLKIAVVREHCIHLAAPKSAEHHNTPSAPLSP